MFPSAVSPSTIPPPPPPPADPSPSPVAPVAAVASSSADALGLGALRACVEDARLAALERTDGPPDPATFAPLVARLERAAAKLPPTYRRAVAEPLLARLRELGPGGFARLLAEDPERQGAARLVLDLAQAVLQPAEGYQAKATAALQEVVSDLYDGFLSAEDRCGVKPPDRGVIAPLVRWGSAEAGPYTWPVTATASFGAGAAVVSLPAANASRGILAWAALAHETSGHDLLGADDGLRDELAERVRSGLLAEKLPLALADYWADRIDETASDVLGVLDMGPAAAVGLVGYFRALNGAWGGTPALRNVGRAEDPHPADIARAYLAAETVRLLGFEGAGRWADRLVAEADRDLGRIRLGDVAVTAAVAKASAAAVARTIVRTRLDALEGHALGEIQGWSDRDEAIVASLRSRMREGGGAAAGSYAAGTYAAHAVAAGVYEAVSGAAPPAQVMGAMIAVLDAMHARNPGFAPGRAGGGGATAVT
jgi:hypothetical protein